MFSNRSTAFVTAIVVGVSANRASADDPTDEDRAAAQEAFARGMDQRAHGDLAGSLVSFKRAHARLPSPITGFELGRAYMLAGKLMAARREFEAVAKSPPKPSESATAKQARVDAAELLRDVTARIPRIDLEVSGAKSVTVTIDGAEVPPDEVDAPRDVDPGTHHVTATHEGLTSNRTVEIAEGERRTVAFVFGTTDVSSYDRERVGAHRTPTWVYGSLAVGGLGVGIGAIAGIVALSDKSSLGCSAGKCPGSQSDVDGLNHATTISTIAFAFGLAGVGLGVYGLAIRPPTSDTPKTATIEPWVGFGSIGLSGRF